MNRYECLGRYTEAYEEFERLERLLKLSVEQIAAVSLDFSLSNQLYQDESMEILESLSILVEKHKKLNKELVERVEQLNQLAESCDKPAIRLYKRGLV